MPLFIDHTAIIRFSTGALLCESAMRYIQSLRICTWSVHPTDLQLLCQSEEGFNRVSRSAAICPLLADKKAKRLNHIYIETLMVLHTKALGQANVCRLLPKI